MWSNEEDSLKNKEFPPFEVFGKEKAWKMTFSVPSIIEQPKYIIQEEVTVYQECYKQLNIF